jgi:hypothetical protein
LVKLPPIPSSTNPVSVTVARLTPGPSLTLLLFVMMSDDVGKSLKTRGFVFTPSICACAVPTDTTAMLAAASQPILLFITLLPVRCTC